MLGLRKGVTQKVVLFALDGRSHQLLTALTISSRTPYNVKTNIDYQRRRVGMAVTATRQTPAPLTIHIDEAAVEHVRAFAEQSGKPDANLRVSVKGGGCSGLTYMLDLVDEPRDDDKVISEHGLQLYVDRKSYIFLAGTTLGYSGGLNGKGFVFDNPNAKTTCGCGTSFGI